MKSRGNKVLFIGNYFSHARGTKPVMDRIAHALYNEEFVVILSSRKSFWLWRAIDHLKAILLKKYSIAFIDVFSDLSFLLAEWSAFWLMARRRKFILTLRGGKLAEFSERNESRVLRLFRKAHSIQTPSLFLKNYFHKNGIEVRYLPNPIDLQKFQAISRSSQPGYKLLWVRAFTAIYNPEVAVLVLHNVLKTFPQATLTMIGPDKGTMHKTQKLIGELGLTSRVSILGPVNNNDLHKYYQSHAVYLNTTSYESFGVAVVEAASCGVPIVSFRVGEIPYLWTDEMNILLCELGDVSKMAMQVSRILSDVNLSSRLSENARKRAEDFSWDKIKSHWIELVTK